MRAVTTMTNINSTVNCYWEKQKIAVLTNMLILSNGENKQFGKLLLNENDDSLSKT